MATADTRTSAPGPASASYSPLPFGRWFRRWSQRTRSAAPARSPSLARIVVVSAHDSEQEQRVQEEVSNNRSTNLKDLLKLVKALIAKLSLRFDVGANKALITTLKEIANAIASTVAHAAEAIWASAGLSAFFLVLHHGQKYQQLNEKLPKLRLEIERHVERAKHLRDEVSSHDRAAADDVHHAVNDLEEMLDRSLAMQESCVVVRYANAMVITEEIREWKANLSAILERINRADIICSYRAQIIARLPVWQQKPNFVDTSIPGARQLAKRLPIQLAPVKPAHARWPVHDQYLLMISRPESGPQLGRTMSSSQDAYYPQSHEAKQFNEGYLFGYEDPKGKVGCQIMVNIGCFVLYHVRNNTVIPAAMDLAEDSADRKLYMVLCDRGDACGNELVIGFYVEGYPLATYTYGHHTYAVELNDCYMLCHAAPNGTGY